MIMASVMKGLRSLNPNCWWVSSFNPVGWWIPHVSLHLGLVKLNSLFLKVQCNLGDFMILPKLFYSFTVYGINQLLKSLVLTLKFGRSGKFGRFLIHYVILFERSHVLRLLLLVLLVIVWIQFSDRSSRY